MQRKLIDMIFDTITKIGNGTMTIAQGSALARNYHELNTAMMFPYKKALTQAKISEHNMNCNDNITIDD